METIIFYSWQNDLKNSTNRSFIQDALEKAIRAVKSDSEIKIELRLDQGTQNTAGTLDIADTIFEKIGNASIFIGDVSIINKRNFITKLPILNWVSRKRLTPNPNVLLELGYAAHHMGWDNIICVFNSAYGRVEDLPFDLRKRLILIYNMPKGIQNKVSERNKLVKATQDAIQSVIGKAIPVQNLKIEVLLDISRACHSWKITYRSISPDHFKETEGKKYIDIWEMMIELSIHKYSIEQWERFIPLFDNSIKDVLERLDTISGHYSEILSFEFKTLILQSKRQLESERFIYLALPTVIINVEDKDNFFSYRFIEVTNVLSKLARKADMLREGRIVHTKEI